MATRTFANLAPYQAQALQPAQDPLTSLIQGFQLPQQIQDQALAQQLNNALIRQKLQDLANPDAATAREVAKQLAIKGILEPNSGVGPSEIPGVTIQSPGAITEAQQASLPSQALMDQRQQAFQQAGTPIPALPTAAAGLPTTPLNFKGINLGLSYNPNTPIQAEQDKLNRDIQLAQARSRLQLTKDGRLFDPTSGIVSDVLVQPSQGVAQPSLNSPTLTPSPTAAPKSLAEQRQSEADAAAQKKIDAQNELLNKKQDFTHNENELKAENQKTLAEIRSDENLSKSDDKTWETIIKNSNPITASSRSALGVVASSDNRANRALVTLQNPSITKQEARNIMSDIAGIYKGGSPTESGEANNAYTSLYGDIQGAIQFITGNPTDALPEAMRQRLIQTVQAMKETNKAVINQNFDIQEATHPDLINKRADLWRNFRDRIGGGLASGIQSTPPTNTTTPAGATKIGRFTVTPQ